MGFPRRAHWVLLLRHSPCAVEGPCLRKGRLRIAGRCRGDLEGLCHHGYPGHAPAAAKPWGVNHPDKKTASNKTKNQKQKKKKKEDNQSKRYGTARGKGRFFLPQVPRVLRVAAGRQLYLGLRHSPTGHGKRRQHGQHGPAPGSYCQSRVCDIGKARGNDNLLNLPLNVRIRNHWLLPAEDSLWEQGVRGRKVFSTETSWG